MTVVESLCKWCRARINKQGPLWLEDGKGFDRGVFCQYSDGGVHEPDTDEPPR